MQMRDAKNLGPVVAGAHVYPRKEDAHGDGPGVEEHAREKIGVLVGLNHHKVSFNVTGSQNHI